MFDLSPEKVLLVLVIALVVLGPNRLPQAARALGRFVANLRQMSTTVQSEVRDALAEPRDAFSSAFGDVGLDEMRDSLNGAVHPVRAALNPMRDVLNPPPAQAAGSGAATESGSAIPADVRESSTPEASAYAAGRPGSALLGGTDPSAPMPPPPDDPTLN